MPPISCSPPTSNQVLSTVPPKEFSNSPAPCCLFPGSGHSLFFLNSCSNVFLIGSPSSSLSSLKTWSLSSSYAPVASLLSSLHWLTVALGENGQSLEMASRAPACSSASSLTMLLLVPHTPTKANLFQFLQWAMWFLNSWHLHMPFQQPGTLFLLSLLFS